MNDYKVYLVRLFNSDESFVKIGFTKDPLEKRMYMIDGYNFEEIGVIDSLSYVHAVFLERSLHARLRMCKYEPSIKFDGFGECFSEQPDWLIDTFNSDVFSLVGYVNGMDNGIIVKDASEIDVEFYAPRIRKQVSFHIEQDKDLLEFLKGKKFSTYIKKLIEKEMRK